MSEHNTARLSLAVAADDPIFLNEAEALAQELSLSCVGVCAPTGCAEQDVLLMVSGRELSLVRTGKGKPAPLSVDFGSGTMRHRRRGGQNEMLGKAVGVGKLPALHVLDATAGLGRDAFVLADLGCRVTLCERHALVAALLADGLARAQASEDAWLSGVAGGMALHAVDAREAHVREVDTIYLDPMFPARTKRAAVKADLALLQAVLEETNQDDAEALLEWALAQDVARVVVKRPLKAHELGDRAPSHAHRGKAVRFDVYVLRAFHQ